ncbi:LLM class flavin-dependent oxidoreductase [Micromonospora lutea]|uniref:Oxidoreductase n=1 Tax=Micromonospora lutea TaxID=419825 RepID=A0ABQ4ITF2_9ACTN|nr:LLM class flavin-dependent oxidoreductase [Micromonospora lutea]GIJ21051.1 oxidoreductase [Micromonospora lutea]
MWIFAISPRSSDPRTAWSQIDTTIRLADRYGFTGVLAHTGNDALFDPWLVGQHALDSTPRLEPLVAVNPVYHHPFAVAQWIAALTHRYQRRVFLNFVTGTATPDRVALGDDLDHDRRYDRLREYAQIVLALVDGAAPLTVTGDFYQLRGARLRLPTPPGLRPVPFIAGQSPAAAQCSRAIEAVSVGMWRPQPPDRGESKGAYAGLIVRESDADAWRVARERYPADPDLAAAGAAALRYTDATWRHQAFAEAEEPNERPTWFWREPMRSMRADCPYLVGGVETLAPVLAAHQSAGFASLILDLAPHDDDFRWAERLLTRARELAGPPG